MAITRRCIPLTARLLSARTLSLLCSSPLLLVAGLGNGCASSCPIFDGEDVCAQGSYVCSSDNTYRYCNSGDHCASRWSDEIQCPQERPRCAQDGTQVDCQGPGED